MKLIQYSNLNPGELKRLADVLGVTYGFLHQMASGHRPISPARAMQIETATGGKVTRREMRPDDAEVIWPELAKKKR